MQTVSGCSLSILSQPVPMTAWQASEAAIYVNMTLNMATMIAGGLSSSIYTQITDVELECDGFLNYDRSTKFTPVQTAAIRKANEELIAAMVKEAPVGMVESGEI